MKKNNWLINKINHRLDYILLGSILICCLVYRLYFFNFGLDTIYYNSDSVSYFAPIDIFKGVVDLYRTPLYIYIIKFFEYLSKEHFIRNLILFQHAISFLSIISFYFIASRIVKNKYVVTATTVVYGCIPILIEQNANIKPEPLAIAGSTFMFFLFVRYIDKPTKFSAISVGFSPFVLIMLKPTYLVLLCIILTFIIVRFFLFRPEKIFLFWCFIGWLIAFAGVLGYGEMNKKYNGEFTISKISLNNSLANIVISQAYKVGGDKEFIAIIDTTTENRYYVSAFTINNEFADNYKICNAHFPHYLTPTHDMLFCLSIPNIVNYPTERINAFVKKSQFSSLYIKYILTRIVKIFWQKKILSLILLIQSIAIVYEFFKYKKIAWIHSFSILFIIGQFITVAIGGIDDWGRLLMPTYPLIMLSTASFTSLFMSSFLDIKRLFTSTYE